MLQEAFLVMELEQLATKAAARKPDKQHSTPHYTDNLKTKHRIRQV
jgi:hypothetical protein